MPQAHPNGRPKRLRKYEEDIESVATKIGTQRLVIVFFRHDYFDAPDHWNIGFLVGATRKIKKEVRYTADWPNSWTRITGKGGLSPLRWALQELDKFHDRHPEAILVVGAADERRASAYKILKRYDFVDGIYRDDKVLFRPSRRHFVG